MLGHQQQPLHTIEINTVYGEKEPRFTQVILWQTYGRAVHVARWYMVEKLVDLYRVEGLFPYVALLARDDGDIWRVRAKYFKRTVTDYDPEEEDRARWPIDRR